MDIANTFSQNDKSFLRLEELRDNEPFVKELFKSYSELYSIEDSIKIFNPDNREVSVIEKLDNILEEIEMKDELAEYIVEIELLREELSKRDKFFKKVIPVMNKFIHYCVGYFLEILSYGNINSFYEYYELSKELDENENQPMIILFLSKVVRTLLIIGTTCYTTSLFTGTISELRWNEIYNTIIDEKGKNIVSLQVHTEFNEYLTEKGFFENQPNKEVCIIS
jgi:hypothetical protein